MLQAQVGNVDATWVAGNCERVFASIRPVRYRCRHHMRALSIILGICATVALQAHENWPQFRGPNADGKSDAKGLPVQWSDTEHVKWKTATPVGHKGWSCPVVYGKQVWVTTATKDGKNLSALEINRDTGKIE